MNRSISMALVLAAFLGPVRHVSAEQSTPPEGDWEARFAAQALAVDLRSGGRTTSAELIDLQAGELELRPGDARDPGERIYIPPSAIDAFTIEHDPGVAVEAALARMRNEAESDDDWLLLRPAIWPMVRFLPLPEENINIHAAVSDYLLALIRTGQNDEAYAMLLKIPLEKVNPIFLQHALNLAGHLVQSAQNQRGLNLLGLIPLDPENEALLEMILRYADEFRGSQNFDEALVLYQRVREAPQTALYRQALLWAAYCHVRLDRVESARLLLQEAQPLQPRDAEFSLHQLVLARIALRDENFRQAMTEVSQGVVFSRIGYPWVPELLFVTGLCYEALGALPTVRVVYDQLKLFFPSNEWSLSGQERRAQLDSDLETTSLNLNQPTAVSLTYHP